MAAALLKQQGYDVIGIFMKLWSPFAEATGDKAENICCSLDAATAARAVAQKLGIPFYVVNFEKEFKRAVVDYYIKEYENGRTPNPCVICNRDIKGELLIKKVLEMDADFLATGHYARKSEIQNQKSEKNSKFKLLTAVDKNKDQTYFLWTLTQEKLAKMLFPIGDFTKPQVREMAKKWGLPTAERRESQGICFIPDRNASGFLARYAKKLTKPGAICDIKGKKIGIHNGLVNYTIGQRERLGLGGPKAYYVVKLKVEENVLVVGDEKDLYKKELIATDLNWPFVASSSKALDAPHGKIGAKIRYGHPIESCKLQTVSRKQVKVTFKKPQRAITPGQSIVFYSPRGEAGEKEEVIGGGNIEEKI